MKEDKQWIGTTYGNGWMHKWLIRLLRYIDVRLLYFFSSVFIVPVCLILNSSCGIIYKFFRNHFGYTPLKSIWKTYITHCQFSQVVIDRFAMYAGKHFNIEIEGYQYYQSLATQKPGFVQLSAHVGNYEIAGYSLVADNKPFNALVFWGEKESVMRNRMKMFSNTNIRMISIKNDFSHLFEIDNALSKGETVSLPSDRMLGSKKYVEIDFLGEKAKFPMGPFSVATMRQLNVLAVNVMKTSFKSYTIYITPLTYDKYASRNEQISQLSENYVRELERIVRLYPTQWYNYFNFWA